MEPPLLFLSDKYEYEKHFINNYCKKKILTFDNIHVRFNKNNFYHSFFEKKKSQFSLIRAERMMWIKDALLLPNTELYIGWNNKKKQVDPYRRVVIAWTNYIVIIELLKKKNFKKAKFITAYVADKNSLKKIRQSPKW